MDRRSRREIENDLNHARATLSDTIAELRHRLMSGDAANEATAYATAALRRPSPATVVALAGVGIAAWFALRPTKPDPVRTLRGKAEGAMHSIRDAVTSGLDEAGRSALARALEGIDTALGDRISRRMPERSGPSTQTVVIGSIAAALIGVAAAAIARRSETVGDKLKDAADTAANDVSDTAEDIADAAASEVKSAGRKVSKKVAAAASTAQRVTAASAPAKREPRARTRKAQPLPRTEPQAPRSETMEAQATA